MSSRLLAIDIGNSRIKAGVFDLSGVDPHQPARRLPECLVSTRTGFTDDGACRRIVQWIAELSLPPDASIVAGANPSRTGELLAAWPPRQPQPVVIRGPEKLPLKINVAAPERVGIDRLLNAVAAGAVRPEGRPAIIVDSGTATTIDAVSSEGAFEGGAILPGFELAARSLHRYTALLPLIGIDELAEGPPAVIGTDTRSALRSGIYWGHAGGVCRLVESIARQLGEPLSAISAYLTGGGSDLLRPQLPDAAHLPHLTLQGLALAFLASGKGIDD